MFKVSTFQWVKAFAACLIFVLWVAWIGSWWMIIGLPFVFDAYVTNIIPWGFWKKTKDGKKPNAFIEWVDALGFALIAVYLINIFLFQNYKIPTSSLEKSLLVGDHLFVSKASFGPRMPNTPLSFPLVQNTFPIINTKSYSEWPHWDYKRLTGLDQVKRNDIVVFNFPAGDTVPFKVNNPDYYSSAFTEGIKELSKNRDLIPQEPFSSSYARNSYLKAIGRKVIWNNPKTFGEVLYRPVDRRDNYVKRCIATPGDVLEIRSNQIFINGEAAKNPRDIQHNYNIETDGTVLNDRFFDRLGIANDDRFGMSPHYTLPLTKEMYNSIKGFPFIKSISIIEEKPNGSGLQVFPFSQDYNWSRDNFGPLTMPKAGETIDLNIQNLLIYERIITAYEGNTLKVNEDVITINGAVANTYTFKMDYYFMLGDNRHKSADSRYWGFVPEDHIVGKPILVWLSLDKDKSFPASIRWDRFFKLAHSN